MKYSCLQYLRTPNYLLLPIIQCNLEHFLEKIKKRIILDSPICSISFFRILFFLFPASVSPARSLLHFFSCETCDVSSCSQSCGVLCLRHGRSPPFARLNRSIFIFIYSFMLMRLEHPLSEISSSEIHRLFPCMDQLLKKGSTYQSI